MHSANGSNVESDILQTERHESGRSLVWRGEGVEAVDRD